MLYSDGLEVKFGEMSYEISTPFLLRAGPTICNRRLTGTEVSLKWFLVVSLPLLNMSILILSNHSKSL